MKPGTELPWSIRTGYSNGEPISLVIRAGLEPIADTVGVDEKDDANARYIAHACNLYPELVEALKVACRALASWRDGEAVDLEELKYMIVDRAIELAEPGFDGGETTTDELRANIANWRDPLPHADESRDRHDS